jgi:subtilisin family serine protease
MLRITGTVRPVLVGAAAALLLALLLALPALPALPAAAAPADAVRDQQQWVLDMLDVPAAWQAGTEGSGVTVAVIDSGVDPDVSDLAGSVRAGPDYTGLHTSPDNAAWGEHGTWMASIIAGHGHDFDGEDGITGIAPAARILSVRVIPDKGDPGYQSYNAEPEERIQQELADGIRAAVKDGAAVISMSIGYSAPSGVVRDAIQYAYSRGAVLVASSGNSGNNDTQHANHGPGLAPVSFPAEYPGVISAGAVDSARQPASFSSGNLSVRVAAPGKGVPAEGRNGLYYTVDGTSPACALVAGVAALIKSKYPKISPALVTRALTATAQQHPAGGYDVLTGFGIVDAAAALARAGQLMTERAPGSPVALSTHYGGGPAAVPAGPVPSRSASGLETFIVLALVFAAALVAGGLGLSRFAGLGRRRRDGHHAA